MEQTNFKHLKCDDGKEYVFNFVVFKMELKRAAMAAKKAGVVSSIERYEEDLAKEISVSPAAIKQWKSGQNGVSDIERIKEIAKYMELKDYKELLIELGTEKRKDDIVMNNYLCETERQAAKIVFEGIVDVISVFKSTNAYSLYDDYGAPSIIDVITINERVENVIKKARFDLNKQIYDRLIQMYFEITCTEVEDVEFKDCISREFAIERLGDAYYNELCDVMKDYIK